MMGWKGMMGGVFTRYDFCALEIAKRADIKISVRFFAVSDADIGST